MKSYESFVRHKMKNKDEKEINLDYNGYLFGLMQAIKFKKEKKWHGMIIITGNVGDGKSTMAEGLAALDANFNNVPFNFDNISWATEKFIEKTDRDDNIGTPQIWDEAIQGASGRSMAITSVGIKLKQAFVTKRFKKHTYILLIDEIEEYSWKLIKMADCWIHIENKGFKRGFFKTYTNKRKIKFIYNAFKIYKKDWSSPEVRNINPDCIGTFPDYSGKFLDSDEYNRLKLEETKQLHKTDKLNWDIKKIKAFSLWSQGKKQNDISKDLNMPRSTFANWVTEFKNVVRP